MKIRLVFAVLIGMFAMTCHQQATAQKHQNSPQKDAPPSITVNNYDHSQHEYQNKPDVPRWWPEGITTLAIIATLIAISIQTYYTRRAAEATLRSVETAEKELILQFRPKMIVRKGIIDGGEAMFHLTNIGGSRAEI